jgi:hypothetical protein
LCFSGDKKTALRSYAVKINSFLRRKKMKRKLILGLIAILAIGLAVVSCSDSSSSGSGGDTRTDFEKLTAWTPDPITEPEGYKDFPEGILDNSGFFVNVGEKGWIEDNEDGTYKVTIVTNPGAFSLVAFQDEDYVYKTGFYLSLDLPTAPHKPLGMIAFAATGPMEQGADWTSAQYANRNGSSAYDHPDKYLAGRVDFAWENENNVWPRRTICLYIYWHDDEEDGAEYEFTVRKILVSDDEDLEPPAYPVTTWKPTSTDSPGEDEDWIDFPGEAILRATYDIGEGPVSNCVTEVSDGYEITVPTRPGGNTIIIIPTVDDLAFASGYYMLVDLPDNDPYLRPIQFYTAASNGATVSGTDWDTAVDHSAPADSYVAGDDIGAYWTGTTVADSFFIQIKWHPAEPEGMYTFTLKKLMITDEDIEIIDPSEYEPWTPDPVTEPTGWETFPGDEILDANFYPWNDDNAITGNTVTVKSNPGGRSLVRFFGDEFKYIKGYYLSITLPDDSTKPQKIYSLAINSPTHDGDWAASDLAEAPDEMFVAGRADFTWDSDTSTAVYTGVMLDIYWYAGQKAELYTFTVNKILVAEETDEELAAEKPDIHEDSELDDATYTVGATADDLVVLPRWTANSDNYDYSWWEAESATADWPATNLNNYTTTFTPPTDTAGTFYYYCIVEYGTEKTLTRIVTITVN